MNPTVPSVTRQLLECMGMPCKRLEWHMRHLEHYLARFPLPLGLSHEHTMSYMSSCHLRDWQMDQVRTAIDALYRSHDRPPPPQLWQVSASAAIQQAGPLPNDADERVLVQEIRCRNYSYVTEKAYLTQGKETGDRHPSGGHPSGDNGIGIGACPLPSSSDADGDSLSYQ